LQEAIAELFGNRGGKSGCPVVLQLLAAFRSEFIGYWPDEFLVVFLIFGVE